MRLNKKIQNDDFITLDYERIRQNVKDNIEIATPQKNTYFHKNLKYGIISLSFLIVILIGVIFIPKITNKPDDYLCYQAASKREIKYSDTKEEGYLNFLDKLDTFSAKISAEIFNEYKEVEENYVISPISLYMGLAMLVESTSGPAREEILNALGMTYKEVEKYTSILYSKMNDTTSSRSFYGTKKTTFQEILTNSIWIDDNIELKEEGLLALANKYHCSSYSAPFYNNNKKANRAIKDYVSKQTKGLINQNFNLDKETLFTLINTYYLKDLWNYDGDDLPFSKTNYLFNNLIEKPFLQGYYKSGKTYETENARHFFTSTYGNIKIKFIIPKDGYNINDIYNEELIKSINNLKDYLEVDYEREEINFTRCIFPEFEASFDESIESIYMQKLGLNKVFTNPDSFAPLTDENAILGSVKHVAKLKVDKKGIEGAAVTIEPAAGASGPGEFTKVYYDFIVDKSFIVIVTDPDNVTLFSGVIYNI